MCSQLAVILCRKIANSNFFRQPFVICLYFTRDTSHYKKVFVLFFCLIEKPPMHILCYTILIQCGCFYGFFFKNIEYLLEFKLRRIFFKYFSNIFDRRIYLSEFYYINYFFVENIVSTFESNERSSFARPYKFRTNSLLTLRRCLFQKNISFRIALIYLYCILYFETMSDCIHF